MSFSQTLTQTTTQHQVLTPMQVQLVRMLEMTGPQVEDEVQRALDEMPALEALPPEEVHAHEATEDGSAFTETDREIQRADFRSEEDMPDYLEGASEGSLYGPVTLYKAPGNPEGRFTDIPVADDSTSLFDALQSQLAEHPLSSLQELAASYIIGNIDDNGYLTRSPSSIANDMAINEGIEVSTTEVAAMIELVQSLDPPGIGATDLRECLLLQLRRLPRTTASLTALKILEEHFDLFSKKHFDKIARAMDIEMPRLKEAVELIRRLNPKPASGLSTSRSEERSRHITPDFFVEADPSGEITVSSLNRIPRLQIEASFASDPQPEPASSPASEKRLEDARLYIRAKREDAGNFIRVLTMRQDTLFKVVSAIVRIQRDFFTSDDDDELIRPMVLRDVAELTGLNLSVISRATRNKYIATPYGVYPLKKFFNEKRRSPAPSADASEEGPTADLTFHKVMARLKEIIAAEAPSHPLSDREITEVLNAEGFNLARRTVAKYRESLGFPVGRLRKSFS